MIVMPVSASPASIARWIGAAPPRQQRAVDVDRAEARQIERPARQDQTVSRDDEHIGCGTRQCLARRRGVFRKLAIEPQAARLRGGDALRHRERLHWRALQLHAATGGAIGLCQHQRDLEAGVMQMREGNLRELGRAGEGDLQASATAGRPQGG
jgi:hypothetical protein